MPSDDLDEFFSTRQRATLRIPPAFDLHDVPETAYMIGDVNVSARFHTFKQRALQAASERAGLQVDTQLYEIGALSHILILKPDQYSNTMMTTFGEDTYIFSSICIHRHYPTCLFSLWVFLSAALH